MSQGAIAVFVDFENLEIGAGEAKLGPFSIGRVMTRLLDKGPVILKKAYADWGRYRGARRPLHEAGFELLEVPHHSYSGKNSADLRLAVDAIDLCHTKPHLHTFAIVSGDSDFSPLVAKLRENGKLVVGVGVKQSCGRLLVEGCDEFVYYDDLVTPAVPSNPGSGDAREVLQLFVETAESLIADRGEPVHGSYVKQVLRRKRPEFDERRSGYRNLNELLRDAMDRDLVEARRDDASGGYVVTATC